jgi:hypothetical protein
MVRQKNHQNGAILSSLRQSIHPHSASCEIIEIKNKKQETNVSS